MAPAGVIVIVSKADPMVQELLRLREDIFDSYDEETFRRVLQQKAEIVRTEIVSAVGRRLFWYQRNI